MTKREQIKQWFLNGLKPKQKHFHEWIDSFWHKEDQIPAKNIEGMDDKANVSDIEWEEIK